jgi:hypothetical protein
MCQFHICRYNNSQVMCYFIIISLFCSCLVCSFYTCHKWYIFHIIVMDGFAGLWELKVTLLDLQKLFYLKETGYNNYFTGFRHNLLLVLKVLCYF